MTGSNRMSMIVWCWFVIAFGVLLMGGAFAATDGGVRFLIESFGARPIAMTPPLRFGYGLMGAVTFGWGLTVLAVASASHLLPVAAARVVWRRIALALVAWFVVDTTISVATGFALNGVSNTVFLLAFLAILARAGVFARA